MTRKSTNKNLFEEFQFPPGKTIGKRYEIITQLGAGWEGEVYLIRERSTQIERAAKFFYPQRNKGNKTSTFHARKLYRLRDCSVLIPYHLQDEITHRGQSITYLVSDFVEGEQLSEYLNRQRGKRLPAFQALHLLHALVSGLGDIHHRSEYHGDLHSDNIIIQRVGLGFQLKLIDFFHWHGATRENMQEDICDSIKIFYEALGGKRHYAKQSKEVKSIICGLKKSLILKKFPRIDKLKNHIETMRFD